MADRKRFDPRPMESRQTSAREIKGARWRYLLAGALGILWWTLPYPTRHVISEPLSNSAPVEASVPFDWEHITPSESLEYSNCGDGFQCARLEVPMDYNRTDSLGRKFTLAVVRLPAKVPIEDPRYGGAVLINPGGPGGPGTLQALISGRNLQLIIDSDNDPSSAPVDSGDKYFDIIGFDPRGVGSTTPAVTCFPDAHSQRNWELQMDAEGMLGSGPDALRRNWQRTQALNSGCSVWEMASGGIQGDEAMMEYVSTPLVARDMISIIERHGEWREKEGEKAQRIYDQTQGPDVSREILRRTQWKVGQEVLLYWGRSYGTLLGMTFAALHPHRVSRVILDGVVDMEKYYEGRGSNVVVDSDAIFDRFGDYCNQAGPEDCPFYFEGGPEAITDAYWTLENQVLNASVPVMASFTRGPEVVTWTDMKTLLRVAVYQPLLSFHSFAYHMSELAKGNPVPMADFKHRKHFGACPSSECQLDGPWSPACASSQENTLYASAAILCTDAEYMTKHTEEQFEKVWTSTRADSATLGDYWSQLQLACVGWKAKAKQKFLGPWGAETAHPMLFVSNLLDPVTSLSSAQHMSQLFPGSVLLQQNSEGHTTIAAPSVCIAKAIRKYFQIGELPPPGTLCEADLKPLIGAPEQVVAQELSSADLELFNVLMAEVKQGFLPRLTV
ncbi:Peptidase S33 tripeptidyl aminopeptidase-like C-terminal [Penicillium macrosclerotiorum]|uniref:Peptidase S33 tripeptidyl aminopeptidase-like C-terminal n=1 Tax=Penicillium macrosclerotiorum TaxID=303699 RepID=UPI002547A674|nr:Peptidase S33 tripeptidyl aminopeptidase-like C-terminal [Penicillium macrosclerotiorum]KAJ5676152.1 Peptidase S33 tripeptidyl aminopeptidase-like C-terminal [Penicillium macrosclerotiorum]